MKRLLFLLLLFLLFSECFAQIIQVKSFVLDENDNTAYTPGTVLLDQNGKKCALIKIETNQTGFSFDVGALGVVKTEQKENSVWVYVPEGVKRITISHQYLGVIRDFDLGQSLRSAKTYLMSIKTDSHSSINDNVSQYSMIDIFSNPSMADIYIDNSFKGRTPQAIHNLSIGDHQVVLKKSGYNDYSTNITLKSDENALINAQLENYSLEKVDSNFLFCIGNVKFKMIYVEGGVFQYDEEKPQIDSYYIGETEVTQELWNAVMNDNRFQQNELKYPAVVNWYESKAFVKTLNRKTGLNFYLPSTNEWEFAACGGNKSKGYKYSGSNQLDSVAWYNKDFADPQSHYHEVKGKIPNELGLYDMSGNMMELCEIESSSDLSVPTRGGSFFRNEEFCTLIENGKIYRGRRTSVLGDENMKEVGFRLALK